ncbi:NAD-dependent epimerase/dehydratase family protein [Clostridium paraputrificum]|uniref:NAD-dependent epimerase/dehydratase family protein n=1 Tax=Clostridium paraputrificum TaxID=29363 RepID=UPI003D348B07
MKNIIIIGGSGYVGQHLAEAWLKKDSTVAITSFSRNGKPENLSPYLIDNNRVKWNAVDVFNYEAYEKLLPEECFAVVDLIGTATEKDNNKFMKINVDPVLVMLQILDKYNIDRGCYISGVMGIPGKNKIFIESKRKAETLIKKSKRNVKIIRPSLIYGERPEVLLMIPFMKCMGVFSKKYKPVNIDDLTEEIINTFRKH